MKRAIKVVSLNTRHRWCLWHIMKNLLEKLKGYKEYQSIKYALSCVVYELLTMAVFVGNWCAFVLKFDLVDKEWLAPLFSEHERWVHCFLKHHFWVDMFTTKRSESINVLSYGSINSKTTLNDILRDKAKMKYKVDFRSMNTCIIVGHNQ